MQYNRIVQLSSGTCIKIDNSLKSSVDSLSAVLETNKKYEDHVTIFSERETVMSGSCFSSNNRVKIMRPDFNDKSANIVFTINTIGLSDGDKIEGKISIISDVGTLDIGVDYTINDKSLSNTIKKLESITDYYEIFESDVEKGIKIFTDKHFFDAPILQNEFALSLYEGLLRSTSINIAIIEFFRAYELDASKFFRDTDDEITAKYLSNTLEDVDTTKFADEVKINDDILLEATELINELRDKEFLIVLASNCVRNNYTDEIAFMIYLRVLEKGSSIAGIYEKFLASIPEDYAHKLPMYLYSLYHDDKSYSFDDKTRLYENILSAFTEEDDVYKLFYQEILEFAVSRIYQNRITDSLINIYNKILNVNIINEDNAANILYIIRTHKIRIKNSIIRKVIMKYTETEKETKYDVVNGIAFVPIFFDSYILLYEDVYGNRFYSEDVTIESLFNRADLEKYIIEVYPEADIIDMTKIIKLGELENFTKEYEIEELDELKSKLNINTVLLNKFKSKTIDYYFNECILDKEISELGRTFVKNLDFSKLNLYEKRKAVKILLACKVYKLAISYVSQYGLDLMEDNDLIDLYSKYIELGDSENKNDIINDMFKFTKERKKDERIVNYLANNFMGSISDLTFIMDSMVELKLDEKTIAKKLLMISLECDDTVNLDHIYDHFNINNSDDEALSVAYLNKKATDYFLDEKEMDSKYFDRLTGYLINNFDKLDEVPLIFLLAITKYISTFKILSNNDLRRILIKAIKRLLSLDYVFAYFKKLNIHYKMPYNIMNKEYIEFHADKDFVPKAILTISGDDEKKEVELSKVYMNIYVKKITVFKNEIIGYEIINSTDINKGVLATGTLSYDENYELEYPKRGILRTTYDYINDAIVNLDRDNIEGLKKVVLDMREKQEISKRMFNIHDSRN